MDQSGVSLVELIYQFLSLSCTTLKSFGKGTMRYQHTNDKLRLPYMNIFIKRKMKLELIFQHDTINMRWILCRTLHPSFEDTYTYWLVMGRGNIWLSEKWSMICRQESPLFPSFYSFINPYISRQNSPRLSSNVVYAFPLTTMTY